MERKVVQSFTPSVSEACLYIYLDLSLSLLIVICVFPSPLSLSLCLSLCLHFSTDMWSTENAHMWLDPGRTWPAWGRSPASIRDFGAEEARERHRGGRHRAELGRARANLVKSPPDVDQMRPRSRTCGRIRAKCGRDRAEIAQNWSKFGRKCPDKWPGTDKGRLKPTVFWSPPAAAAGRCASPLPSRTDISRADLRAGPAPELRIHSHTNQTRPGKRPASGRGPAPVRAVASSQRSVGRPTPCQMSECERTSSNIDQTSELHTHTHVHVHLRLQCDSSAMSTGRLRSLINAPLCRHPLSEVCDSKRSRAMQRRRPLRVNSRFPSLGDSALSDTMRCKPMEPVGHRYVEVVST